MPNLNFWITLILNLLPNIISCKLGQTTATTSDTPTQVTLGPETISIEPTKITALSVTASNESPTTGIVTGILISSTSRESIENMFNLTATD